METENQETEMERRDEAPGGTGGRWTMPAVPEPVAKVPIEPRLLSTDEEALGRIMQRLRAITVDGVGAAEALPVEVPSMGWRKFRGA